MGIFRALVICSLAVAVAASLDNFPRPVMDEISPPANRETAVLAGGCFWGVEAVFDHVKGVTGVVSGYAGGDRDTARSELVERGGTGHAESVKITYDPSRITYGQLLEIFFAVAHDPTQSNRQGPDVGSQYRSVIFYSSDEQKNIAEAYIRQLDAAGIYPGRIVTELTPLQGFYAAERVHQHFSEHHPDDPYVLQNDLPKIKALKRQFPELYH